jgi:spermidine dehydrogenase
MTSKRSKGLGLERPITRRDFVQGSAVLAGGLITGCDLGTESAADSASSVAGATAPASPYGFDVGEAWYGPGGVGDYSLSHGNTPGVVRAAHAVRAGLFDQPQPNAIDDGEEYDLVVVGGGISGLSAAHHFRRLNPQGRCLIIDNHPIFGGEAKRNEVEVNGHRLSGPQGSNDFGVLPQTGAPDDYFTSLGIPREFEYREPEGSAAGMRIPTDNYSFLHWQHDQFDVGHFFDGERGPRWVRDLWQSGLSESSWTPEVQNSFRSAREEIAANRARGDLGPWLDGMTMRDYYERVLQLPREVTSYVDPILASIIGLGCDGISAWWGQHFELPGFQKPDRYEGITFHSFPGGNAGIARYFLKNLIPDGIEGSGELSDVLFGRVALEGLDLPSNPVRMRLESTVVRVEHEGPVSGSERVAITYTNSDQVRRLTARAVVMASGGWINRRVLRDLPASHTQAYSTFNHSAVLVANVALTNWRFLERLGVSAGIWSGGFGFYCNIRRPMIVGGEAPPLHPDQPAMLTFYAPHFSPGLPAPEQGIVGRTQVLSTSFADYELQIREHMVRLFGDAGFNPVTDIAGLVLNRWGHAYLNPGPGFMFGRDGAAAPPDVIREPFGRVAIGHSELDGHQSWTGAAAEGRRAVEALLDRHF